MTVLVTGANGLLGVNLIRQLIGSNFQVKAFVRPSANLKGLTGVPCQLVRGDLLSSDHIYSALDGCDAVVHAASTTSVLPVGFEFYKRINFDATKNIVHALLRLGNKRLIYVSTANTFGPGSKKNPATESSAFTLGHYGSGYINSKYMAQRYVLDAVKQYNLDAVVVNPTFMIGPYDTKPSSGKLILHALKHGIQWCPRGGKNFVHVRDVAQGILSALTEATAGQCYLLAGENLTYAEFFSLLNKTAGRSPILVTIPKAIIRLAGILGQALIGLLDKPLMLNKTNARLITLDNYYSGEKAQREFKLQISPVSDAITEALAWFRKEHYISEDNYSTQGTNFDL
jgi:dihydroflavonol-4-reductase